MTAKNSTPSPTPPLPPAAEAPREPSLQPGDPVVGTEYYCATFRTPNLFTRSDAVTIGQPITNAQGQQSKVLRMIGMGNGLIRAEAGEKDKPETWFYVDFWGGAVASASVLVTGKREHEAPKTDPAVAQLLNTVATLTPEQRKTLRDSMASEPGKAA